MATRTLSFRLPEGWPQHLDGIVWKYHFTSLGEMLKLVLTEAVYNTMAGKLKLKGRIATPTVVIGVRLPEATHRAITDICCKQVKDTPSVWCALAIAWWCNALEKEETKQEKRDLISYRFFLSGFANNYCGKAARLQYEIDQRVGV